MNIAHVLRTPLLWLGFLRPETLLHDQGRLATPAPLSPHIFSPQSRILIPGRAPTDPSSVDSYPYHHSQSNLPKENSYQPVSYEQRGSKIPPKENSYLPRLPNLPPPRVAHENKINSSFSHKNQANFLPKPSPITERLHIKSFSGPGTIPPLIPRSLLFGYSDYEYASMSPDGLWLAYLAPYNGVQNVFVASLVQFTNKNTRAAFGGSQLKGIPMSNELRRPVLFFQWTYQNGTLIYYHDNDGDENFIITKVNANTRQATPFVEVKGVRADILAMSADKPEELVLGINDRDPRYFDPYLIDISSGHRQLLLKNDRFSELFFDQQLQLRLAKQQTENGSDEYYHARGSPGEYAWTLYRSVSRDDSLMTKPLRFDASGNLLFWVDNTNRDKSALIETIFDKKIARVVYEPTQSDISEVNFNPETGRPVFVRVNYERQELVAVDESLVDVMPVLKSMPGDITIEDMSNDMTKWLISYTQDIAPKSYYLYERGSNRLKPMFTSRQQLRRYPLSKMHPIQIPTRDNYLQLCYLSLPLESDPNGIGRPNSPLATVVWVHGGPTARNNWGFDDWAQFYSNRGYAVLQCNYRGSLGLGKHWLNLGNGEWSGRMHDDIVDAVNWAIGQGITIRDAVAIGGGSYGGYETLVALSFTPQMFSCGIDMVGPSNLVTLLRSVPPYWKPMLNQLMYRVGGNPNEPEGIEHLKSASPIFSAHRIIRPLLIAHGANDPRVHREESDQIVAALKSKQLPVTYVVFPDEGHGIERQENREAFAALAEMFLQKCLGGRAEPLSDHAGSSMQLVEQGNMTRLNLQNTHSQFQNNFIHQNFNGSWKKRLI